MLSTDPAHGLGDRHALVSGEERLARPLGQDRADGVGSRPDDRAARPPVPLDGAADRLGKDEEERDVAGHHVADQVMPLFVPRDGERRPGAP